MPLTTKKMRVCLVCVCVCVCAYNSHTLAHVCVCPRMFTSR